MNKIQMVDLQAQYLRFKDEIDTAIHSVIDSAAFINGPSVRRFNEALSVYLGGAWVHSCANGTDALQLALMALDLKPGDEIIMPTFTYFATVEVALLLGLRPVFVDVLETTFNINPELIAAAINPRTKAILPVHLFGQPADMQAILSIARQHGLYVVEDNAQAMGAHIRTEDGARLMTGTVGHIGCTSFFPSKNLGCYGDGGAVIAKDEQLYARLKALANHGQKTKYVHDMVGINSRLDTIQAAVLNAKLPHLDGFNSARRALAEVYDEGFAQNANITTPVQADNVYHVFHQYTIKLASHLDRDMLQKALAARDIPTMVYYPIPCHQQQAYLQRYPEGAGQSFPVAERLAPSVLSLPMHPEMSAEQAAYIIHHVNELTRAS